MKTIVLSMITFFTSVVMMSTGALAQQLSAPAINYEQASKECELQGKTSGSARTSCLQKLLHGSKEGAFDDSCKSAKDSLSKFQSEFSKACGQFSGLSIGGSCEKAFKSCEENGLDNYEDDEEEGEKKTVDRAKYASCPMPAIKDAKKATEEIKRLEDKIEGFEDRLEKAKEKVQEAKTDIETAQAERVEENNKREAQHENDVKEKGLEQESKTEAAQKKIDGIEKGIRELEQAKLDQDVQYTVDLAKIEGICEEIAEKALSAKVTAEANNVSKNQQKQRNLQAQLTLKSKGRTAENEAFRKREIARCRADQAKWKKPIELLNVNYKNNRIKIDTAIQQLITDRTKAYTELNSTLPQKQQQEAAQLQARYDKDLAAIKTKYDTKIGQCGNFQAMQGSQPNQTQVPNGCTGLSAKQAQAAADQNNIQQKLDDAQSDLEYYKELLRAASSVLKDPEANDVLSLTSTGGDYKSALKEVIDVCQNNEQVSPDQMLNYRKYFEAAGGEMADLPNPSVSSDSLVGSEISEAKAIADGKATSSAETSTSTSGGKQRGSK